MSKTIQTLQGPVFVAGKTKECANPDCEHSGKHYYANRVLSLSLPSSTYSLDVLAYIGWQHEKEHKQFVEIQRELNQRKILVNERIERSAAGKRLPEEGSQQFGNSKPEEAASERTRNRTKLEGGYVTIETYSKDGRLLKISPPGYLPISEIA